MLGATLLKVACIGDSKIVDRSVSSKKEYTTITDPKKEEIPDLNKEDTTNLKKVDNVDVPDC